MQTFDQALLRLLRRGLIRRDVAISAATSPGDLDLQLRMGGEEEEMLIEGHRDSSYHEVPLHYAVQGAEAAPPEVEDKDLELAQAKAPLPATAAAPAAARPAPPAPPAPAASPVRPPAPPRSGKPSGS